MATPPSDAIDWVRTSPSILAKALRFAIVGAASSLIYAVIAMLLVGGLEIAPKIASVVAYLVALPLNFLANRSFAFQSAGELKVDATRYALLHAAGMAIAFVSMSFAVDYLGGNYLIGVAITVVLVPAFNFLVANFWVFSKQRGR